MTRVETTTTLQVNSNQTIVFIEKPSAEPFITFGFSSNNSAGSFMIDITNGYYTILNNGNYTKLTWAN